jgi:serine/threonine-protein kinase HipA
VKAARTPKRLNVVWHDGRVVGELLHSGPILFRYVPAWLETGHNLSPLKLPFDARPINCHDADDGVPGMICDALPDTWGRRVAETVFAQLSLGNPTIFRLMAWVGSRGLGALGFLPAMEVTSPTDDSSHRILVSALEREARAVVEGDITVVLSNFTGALTGGGAHPKVLVVAKPDNTLRLRGGIWPLADGEKPCILKLNVGGGYRHRAELAYLQMAMRAGIATPGARILTDEMGRDHLLIERFDVGHAGRRHHLHSLSGLLHRPRGGLDYADLMRACARLRCPRSDLLAIARRLLFNLRAGNQDDHGKNHAFLYDEEARTWALAPAFDLTHSPGLDRGMKIGGEVIPQWSRLQQWLFGAVITPDEINAASHSVDAALMEWPAIASAAGVPEAQVAEVAATHRRIAVQLSG